jgi:hypothetical protein
MATRWVAFLLLCPALCAYASDPRGLVTGLYLVLIALPTTVVLLVLVLLAALADSPSETTLLRCARVIQLFPIVGVAMAGADSRTASDALLTLGLMSLMFILAWAPYWIRRKRGPFSRWLLQFDPAYLKAVKDLEQDHDSKPDSAQPRT